MRLQTLTVGGIQAPLTRRGLPTRVNQVPALKGRPTVKCRDAAAKKASLELQNQQPRFFNIGQQENVW